MSLFWVSRIVGHWTRGVPCCACGGVREAASKKIPRGCVSRKFRVTTPDSNHAHPVFDNRLNRNFTATGMNQKWAADIVYIPPPKTFCTWLESSICSAGGNLASGTDALTARSPAETPGIKLCASSFFIANRVARTYGKCARKILGLRMEAPNLEACNRARSY